MPNRRGVLWLPFSEGAVVTTLAAGNTTRLDIGSIREAEVGREYEGYTVTRSLLTIKVANTSGGTNVWAAGLIVLQENVALATVTPAATPSADWLWHEEFVAANLFNDATSLVHRDLASQRKARGGDSILWLYITNRGASAVSIHRAGRVLIKRA